jgi:hypothetical protein
MQQQHVAGRVVKDLRRVRDPGQRAEPQRRGRLGHGQRGRSALAQQQRGRMAAQDQPHDGLAVRDVGHGQGGEPLPEVGFRAGELGQAPAHAAVQVADQLGQRQLLPGRGAERLHQHRGLADGGQPAAPHVADDQPGGIRGTGQGIEVPADMSVGLGGVIGGGHRHRPGAFRQRAQDHALGRLGDQPHPDELALAPVPQVAEEHQRPGEQDQREHLHQDGLGGQHGPFHPRDHQGDGGQRADQRDPAGAGEGGRHRGGQGQHREEMHRRRDKMVNQRHGGDQRQRPDDPCLPAPARIREAIHSKPPVWSPATS